MLEKYKTVFEGGEGEIPGIPVAATSPQTPSGGYPDRGQPEQPLSGRKPGSWFPGLNETRKPKEPRQGGAERHHIRAQDAGHLEAARVAACRPAPRMRGT